MAYALDLFQITFTRNFAPPIFEAASSVALVLKKFHELISPTFPLAASDLQATSGTNMADAGARIRMFDNQLTLELTPERLTFTAKQLRTTDDLAVVTKVAVFAHEAVASLFPESKSGEVSLTVAGWLKSNAPTDPTAADVFLRNAPSKLFSALEGEAIQYPLRMRINNAQEGYSADLTCELSAIPSAQLFYNLILKARPQGAYLDTLKLAGLADVVVRRWFAHLGVPLVEPPKVA